MIVERELPEPNDALFPQRAQRERMSDTLTQLIESARERVARGSVMPSFDRQSFRGVLRGFDFESPVALPDLLRWIVEQLESGVVHLTHPRYFGLFNPAPTFPAECADRIAGSFNPQLASSGTSPVPVEIEAHVIGAVAARAGLPDTAVGHFTTSGSEANYTALVCALTRAEPRFGHSGARAFAGPATMYTSRECQPAWFKIAHQAGIGRSALRLIDTDELGRMDMRALERAVTEDRAAGKVPVMIAATAGTTGGGTIDPLVDCAEFATREHLWYHVDAAWGGAALVSERLRGLLAGIERADSVTIDAHKWFATTMACGMFLTARPEVLSESFRVTTDFMPSSVASLDPYLNTVHWSRRFMGLRLFLALAAAGWSGYAQHIERAASLIGFIKERLLAAGWSVLNDSQLAVLCAVPPAGSASPREVVRRVLASGRAWVAATTFGGRDVVRICATHGESTLRDAEELIAALEAAR
jgi:glutamate/tyrosine decarboxylase-like PLP-dependent enzyme